MTRDDLQRITDDAQVGMAAHGRNALTGGPVDRLPPRLWDALRIELQSRYRNATGETLAVLSIDNSPIAVAQPEPPKVIVAPEIDELKERLAEAEAIIAERDDRMALVDRIADLIGLPHDQELDQVAFELWFSANKSAKGNVKGLTELEAELLAALKLFKNTIIGEVHDRWDEGMRAGKLIVALANPTLVYRADISSIHAAIAKAEARAATTEGSDRG